MLSQLEFKLSVEKQYKDGVEKMVRLYQDEGDKRSKADAEGRRIESKQKILLLKQALKRYEDLHVDMESGADAPDGKITGPELDDAGHAVLIGDPDDSLNSPNMRKPLSGSLTMFIHQVKDVPHASANRFSRGPETFVIVKVEDTVKGRTKPTRNDKWAEELPVLDIEKANEIELTVYDKSGPYPTPIGMLWIRISDIAEEMRRKKLESELNNSQWVTADKMDNGSLHSRQDSAYSLTHMAQDRNSKASSNRESQSQLVNQDSSKAAAKATAIDAWFALEPVGSIHLTMSFSRCFFFIYQFMGC
jgi:classical protein kinase C